MKKILIVDDIQNWVDFHTKICYELFGEDILIDTSNSATDAYNKLLQNCEYDIIFTDLQMENFYEPMLAGEWLVNQIKKFDSCLNAKVVIISASYNARIIANDLGVSCIPKATAANYLSAYKEVLGIK